MDTISAIIKWSVVYNVVSKLGAKPKPEVGSLVYDVAESKIGKLTGKLDGLAEDERKMVNDLLADGKNVEIIPRSNVLNEKTPDFLVNGVKTELKTLNGTSLNTPLTRIQKAFGQGASTVIIDGRKTGITVAQANTILNRAQGKYGGVIPGKIEIWTTEGIITR